MKLHLTRFSSDKKVCVATSLTKKLSTCQIHAIRIIYKLYSKSKNVILQNDHHMNEAIQISAFLTAIDPCATLIFCREENIKYWYHEICENTPATVEILTRNSLDDICDRKHDVVIVGFRSLKLVKPLKQLRWTLFVVDDIDSVIKSNYIKNINCNFKIGITHQKLIKNTDLALKYKLLKWANKSLVAEESAFIRWERRSLRNLESSMREEWQKHTWCLYKSAKPTENQINAYEAKVDAWIKDKRPELSVSQETPTKRQYTRKKPTKKPADTENIAFASETDSQATIIDENPPNSELSGDNDILDLLFKNNRRKYVTVKQEVADDKSDSQNVILNALFDGQSKAEPSTDGDGILDSLFR